jgi:hypothetical protein
MKEASWNRLLRQIRDGMVVPVIGPRLLVDAQGEARFQGELARQLRRRYGLDEAAPLPRFRELNAVVHELKAAQVRLQDLYSDISDILSELAASVPLPEPIRQLAEITDFRLLVTLTPDDLLARCLRRRVHVNEIVHSPYLPTSEDQDLPADWHRRQAEVHLLYLFGKARTAPMFAVHDEDVLEYAHNVMSRGSHSRERFIGELRHRDLLFLGANFPDWLSRFFLRATNQSRLLAERPKRDWLVDGHEADDSLTVFLRSFSQDTEVLADLAPHEFVAQLHARWLAAQPSGAGAAAASAQPEAPPPGALFFVSYCRGTDRAAAETLVAYLREKLGVGEREVWFDRQAIEPGDSFAASIAEGIRGCRYFIPIVSRASDAIAERFFRREWNIALERERAIMGERFVIPHIVDADYQPAAYARVPEAWRDRLDFAHAPGGVPDARTAETLKSLVRQARRAAQERA